MSESTTYGSAQFQAAMKGVAVTGHPPTGGHMERSSVEFSRFADLTKKLAKVPKSEVDAKRKG